MILPIAIQAQPQINAAITEVVRLLSPAVIRIRYDIGEDWSGDSAIFFRVLLSDEATRENSLRDISKKVERELSERLDVQSMGMFAYFNFRSQSEQAELNDPAWA